MEYVGSLKPVMTWARSDGESLSYESHEINGEDNGTLKMISKVQLNLNAKDNGLIISCSSYFKVASATSSLQPNIFRASNYPGYKHKWNFAAVVSCKLSQIMWSF